MEIIGIFCMALRCVSCDITLTNIIEQNLAIVLYLHIHTPYWFAIDFSSNSDFKRQCGAVTTRSISHKYSQKTPLG